MKLKIFSTAIFSLLLFVSNGQTLTETFDYAESQYSVGNLNTALQAYERVLFFDPRSSYTAEVYERIADCYLHNADYKDASNFYDLAYYVAVDSKKVSLSLNKAYCLLLNKEPKYALVELYNLPDKVDAEEFYRSELLLGSAQFLSENFEPSRQHFLRIARDAKDSLEIVSLFKRNDKVSKINPKTAQILSLILPGLGQFYLGDVKNGLNSLILVTGIVYLGVRVASTYSFIDAFLAVLPWAQRYYIGGLQRASDLAKKKILTERVKIYEELIGIFDEGYDKQ